MLVYAKRTFSFIIYFEWGIVVNDQKNMILCVITVNRIGFNILELTPSNSGNINLLIKPWKSIDSTKYHHLKI